MAVSIHGNNGVITTNGTAAAPSFAAPDNDTGLYFGTNLIHASTDGTERLRIQADGNVAIGTNAVSSGDLATGTTIGLPKLHVDCGHVGNGAYHIARFRAGSDNDNNAAVVTINNSNDNGIALYGGRSTGTRSWGAIKSIDTSGRVSNAIEIIGDEGQGVQDLKLYTGDSTTTTQRLHIKADGKIEVPTTGKLSLGMSSPAAQFTAGTANGSRVIEIQGTDGVIRGYNRNGSAWAQIDFEASAYTFDTAGTLRMTLTGDGPHLLLGGTSDVNEITESSANAGMVIGGSGFGNAGLAIINSTSGTGRIYFGDNVGNHADRNRGQINYYHNGDYMLFATAGSEKLRIDSDGNLTAVNTTSGATTGVTLKVGASAASGTNSGTVIINNGGLGNASLQFDYEGSAARAKIYTYRSTNDIIFDTSGNEKYRFKDTGELHISDRNSANAGEHIFQAGSFGIRMQDTGGYNRWNIERNYGGWQSTPIVHLSAQGRVGINQASPGCALNVKAIGSASDGLQVTSSSHSSYFWQIQNNDNLFNGSLAGELGIRGSSGISFSANAGTSTQFRITSAGQVRLPANGQELAWGASQQFRMFWENSEDRMYLKSSGAYGLAFRINNGNRIEITGTTGDVTMQGASGRNFTWDNSAAELLLTDNNSGASARLKIGSSGDLQMYHDVGSHLNLITCATNADLKVSTKTLQVYEYTGVTKKFEVTNRGKYIGYHADTSSYGASNFARTGSGNQGNASQGTPEGSMQWQSDTSRGVEKYKSYIQTTTANQSGMYITIQNAAFYRITVKASHNSTQADVAMWLVYGLNSAANATNRITQIVNSGSFTCVNHNTHVNSHDSTIKIDYSTSCNQGLKALVEVIGGF